MYGEKRDGELFTLVSAWRLHVSLPTLLCSTPPSGRGLSGFGMARICPSCRWYRSVQCTSDHHRIGPAHQWLSCGQYFDRTRQFLRLLHDSGCRSDESRKPGSGFACELRSRVVHCISERYTGDARNICRKLQSVDICVGNQQTCTSHVHGAATYCSSSVEFLFPDTYRSIYARTLHRICCILINWRRAHFAQSHGFLWRETSRCQSHTGQRKQGCRHPRSAGRMGARGTRTCGPDAPVPN